MVQEKLRKSLLTLLVQNCKVIVQTKIILIILCTTGRQVYEDDKESDDDNDISSINDSEELQPILINEHLNNPLIKMDLKVYTFFVIFSLLKN